MRFSSRAFARAFLLAELSFIVAASVLACSDLNCPSGTIPAGRDCVAPFDAGSSSSDAADSAVTPRPESAPIRAPGGRRIGSVADSGVPNQGDRSAASSPDGGDKMSIGRPIARRGAGGSSAGARGDAQAGSGQTTAGADAAPTPECQVDEIACDDVCVAKTDPRNCGACENDCTQLPNVKSTVRCENSSCRLAGDACTRGWADCNGRIDDGCESNLAAPEHCGQCDQACGADAPLCSASAAGSYACVNGCEESAPTKCGNSCVDTQVDPKHCGGCNKPCPVPTNAEAMCAEGRCTSRCKFGYHECEGACVDDRAVSSCGVQCMPCPGVANAASTCDGSMCGFNCKVGFHKCGNRCVSDTDVATCGARCEVCPMAANATATCMDRECGLRCNDGYHDDGGTCEPNTTTACCGSGCETCTSGANATAACENGQCVQRCNSGYHASGGTCEPNTTTACCGASCEACKPRANAASACVSGKCVQPCDAGYHESGGVCVPNDTTACCGASCEKCASSANAVAACEAGQCVQRCSQGYHGCPQGCVEDNSVDHCGKECSPCAAKANQSVSCTNSVCEYACSGNTCNGMCVGRKCAAGESCATPTSCDVGLVCNKGRCEASTAECGNKKIEPGEECEVDVDGATIFTCGPAAAPDAQRCKRRTIYIPCDMSGTGCDEKSSCQLGAGGSGVCLPVAGIGVGGQRDPSTACPYLPGYTQSFYNNSFCVIDCATSTCPPQVKSCATNPLAGSSPYDATKYCVPGT